MADYKLLYELANEMLARYQDELIPHLREKIAELERDRVEVVRCRDCKHYQYGVMFPDIKFCCRLKGSKGETVRYNWSDNDYCSYGERKEKGDSGTPKGDPA